MNQQPTLLFVTLLNEIGSDRIVAAMGHLGARCIVLGPVEAFATRSRYVAAHIPLPDFGGVWMRRWILASTLERSIAAHNPKLIIPLDDLAARSLRDPALLRRASGPTRDLIARSFGRPDNYPTACSRALLIDRARQLGLPTPDQVVVTNFGAAADAAKRFGYPVVLKREETCGGSGVSIIADHASLRRAFRRARTKALAKAAISGSFGFRSDVSTALTLQRYIAGQLAFGAVACLDGVVLDGIGFVADHTNPPLTGACTILRPVAHAQMDETVRRLVADLGCSGFVAFDFQLSARGEAVLIEMNPRPIASAHLGRLFGHDIYAALYQHLDIRARWDAVATRVVAPESIALFPRELDRDPSGAKLGMAPAPLHDVPWDDPNVVDAYAAWLERRHPAHHDILRRHLTPAEAVPLYEESGLHELSPLHSSNGAGPRHDRARIVSGNGGTDSRRPSAPADSIASR